MTAWVYTMPTYHPDDWEPKRPPGWRWDWEWYVLAFVLAVIVGLLTIIVVDGKGLP